MLHFIIDNAHIVHDNDTVTTAELETMRDWLNDLAEQDDTISIDQIVDIAGLPCDRSFDPPITDDIWAWSGPDLHPTGDDDIVPEAVLVTGEAGQAFRIEYFDHDVSKWPFSMFVETVQ